MNERAANTTGEFHGPATTGATDLPTPLQRRARRRVAGAILWTGTMFVCWTVGALPAAVTRKSAHRWRAWILRGWARGVARALHLHIEVRGTPPRRPFFLVCNHLSYLDIVTLASQIGGIFVAKAELATWPALGFLSRAMGTIFIDRSSKRDALRTLARIGHTMDAGGGVVIFPEGTSSAGDEVMPFKPALLEWAAREAFPVTVASLTYATDPPDPPAYLAVCWWGDMTFTPHLTAMASLRRIRATITFQPASIQDRDRRSLAGKLRAAVAETFVPTAPRERP